jgi:phosphate transport system permease protein
MLGEPKIWLTALGLTAGVGMILFLLGLILVNGVAVLWPKDVIQFKHAADGKILAGELRKHQLRRDASTGRMIEEYLVFLGNKDALGSAFRYIDASAITEQTEPKDILVAERMEYGDSIFYPVSVQDSAGVVTAASDAGFFPALQRLIDEGHARRSQITKLEKNDIGAINKRLSRLVLDEKAGRTSSADAATQRAQLQADYDTLAAQAKALRDAQHVAKLSYRLADGTERSQPVSELVHVDAPNALSLMGKLSLFLRNSWALVSEEPREANTEGGIFPAIFGTFVMTLLMSLLVTPFGVIAAIYLREYAKQGLLVRAVRISVNNLAGVPSIVFGVFGVGFFVYLVGGSIDEWLFSDKLPTPTYGTGGILWASFTLALLTLPVIIVASEEALSAVPRGVREAALACGASKWQSIQRIVLPSALPGILTGIILSMARGAGEVAPLMLVGVVKLAPSLPLDLTAPFIHPERKFMHLGFHIYDLGFQSPDSEAAKPMVFATTLLLILLVLVLNLTAILLRNRLRKKYAGSAF